MWFKEGKGDIHKAHINIHGETPNYEESEWLSYDHHSGYSG
jgi:hypothetical protein